MSGELLHVWGRVVRAGPRRAAASSTSGPGVLGSRISRDLWGAIRCHLSSKPGRPGEGSSEVPGTGRVAGPSRDPTFAFHVVVHLKLHLAGPEDVALGTAEVAAVTVAGLSKGCWILGRGGQGAGALGAGFSGRRALGRKRPSQPASSEKHGVGVYGVGARNSPISVQLPDRPQRTFLIPEVELEAETKRQRQAELETRGERHLNQVPIEDAISNTPARCFAFSASPFPRWNTEPQRGEEKCPTSQAKGVNRGSTGPQDFQIQPHTTQVEKVDTEGIEKDRDVHRDRCKETEMSVERGGGAQSRGLWADAPTCRTAMAMIQAGVGEPGTEFCLWPGAAYIGAATQPWAGL